MKTLISQARTAFMGDEEEDTRTVKEALSDMARFLARVGANLSWSEIVEDDAGSPRVFDTSASRVQTFH